MLRIATVVALALLMVPTLAVAQTDEIQVYDASIAPRGVLNLTLHNNFTPHGLHTPAFAGGLVPNHSFNGVAEWAYGVKDWFEVGLYLPLYSISQGRGGTINGGKIRFLFAVPHADERRYFCGINFEFSYNSRHWDPRRFTSEIRPIAGVHLRKWDMIVNPILDNSFAGGFQALDFAPAARLAYHLFPKWEVAAEEYADFGPLNAFFPPAGQSHEIWGVFDHLTSWGDIEAGIGFGLTNASDPVTLKFMYSRDLHDFRHKP